jgi:hypothetical protein
MPKGEVICADCGQYESTCRCGLPPSETPKELRLSDEQINKIKESDFPVKGKNSLEEAIADAAVAHVLSYLAGTAELLTPEEIDDIKRNNECKDHTFTISILSDLSRDVSKAQALKDAARQSLAVANAVKAEQERVLTLVVAWINRLYPQVSDIYEQQIRQSLKQEKPQER